MINWGIPQFIIAVMMFLNLAWALIHHGQRRTNHNFWVVLFDVVWVSLVLWWGGFWG